MVRFTGIQHPDGMVTDIVPFAADTIDAHKAHAASIGGALVEIDDIGLSVDLDTWPYEVKDGRLVSHSTLHPARLARERRKHLAEIVDERRRYQAAAEETGEDFGEEIAELDAQLVGY